MTLTVDRFLSLTLVTPAQLSTTLSHVYLSPSHPAHISPFCYPCFYTLSLSLIRPSVSYLPCLSSLTFFCTSSPPLCSLFYASHTFLLIPPWFSSMSLDIAECTQYKCQQNKHLRLLLLMKNILCLLFVWYAVHWCVRISFVLWIHSQCGQLTVTTPFLWFFLVINYLFLEVEVWSESNRALLHTLTVKCS